MRQPRIKIPAASGEALYHCTSKTVNGEFLFEAADQEELRRLLRRMADACGVDLINYTILSNHIHALVRIREATDLSDEELLRRYKVLHPKPTPSEARRIAVIAQELAANTEAGIRWRKQMLALMNDISQFMKLVKQRFTQWYNRQHRRFGTIWAGRFKSVLVQPISRVVRIVAGYIDLNPLRAGLSSDPKDYRNCSYADAVAGDPYAQRGIMWVMGSDSWDEAQSAYRQMLFAAASAPREGARSITHADLLRVLNEGGKLSPATVLRCRLAYLTAGGVLGAKAFVREHAGRLGRRGNRACGYSLPRFPGWDDVATLQKVRIQ